MHALDKKLLRDFKRLWRQAFAIAMVLACGVAILLGALGTYKSLIDTRKTYYERNRFADVFSAVKRAPDRLAAELAAIDGVGPLKRVPQVTQCLMFPAAMSASPGRSCLCRLTACRG